MKTYLITGGYGFIGKALVTRLLRDNNRVIVIDSLSRQIHGDDVKIDKSFLNHKLFSFYKADVTNFSDLDYLLKECDYIYHLASETGTAQSNYEIKKYTETNVLGITAIFECIIKNQLTNIKKFFLSSSRSVYGEGVYSCSNNQCSSNGKYIYPDNDEARKHNWDFFCSKCSAKLDFLGSNDNHKKFPQSFYALTKSFQEEILKFYSQITGIDYIIYRFQNVYGPGQSLINPYTGLLTVFFNCFCNSKDINVFEDGYESRDFIYINDLIEIILKLNDLNIKNTIIDIGSGLQTRILDIALLMKKILKSKQKVNITMKSRVGDIRHAKADISKLKLLLGNFEFTHIEDGLEMFCENAQKSNKGYQSNSEDSELEKYNLYKK